MGSFALPDQQQRLQMWRVLPDVGLVDAQGSRETREEAEAESACLHETGRKK